MESEIEPEKQALVHLYKSKHNNRPGISSSISAPRTQAKQLCKLPSIKQRHRYPGERTLQLARNLDNTKPKPNHNLLLAELSFPRFAALALHLASHSSATSARDAEIWRERHAASDR